MKMLKMFGTWCVLLLCCVHVCVEGRSTGAPLGACQDMTPHHNATAMPSPAPYTITATPQSVGAGQSVEVVVAGQQEGDTLRGYLLQARQGNDIVGTFHLKDGDNFSQLMNCGKPGNAVTQKKHNNKEDMHEVRVYWSPPEGLTGEVVFRATIVKTLKEFWVAVPSAPLKILS